MVFRGTKKSDGLSGCFWASDGEVSKHGFGNR